MLFALVITAMLAAACGSGTGGAYGGGTAPRPAATQAPNATPSDMYGY